jgi:hypothetical protein
LNETLDNVRLFVGRLHSVIVFLPISGLMLLGLLEVLSRFERWKTIARDNLLLMILAFGSALASAVGAWTLAGSGEYDPDLLKWYPIAGYTLAVICVIAAALLRMGLTQAYRLCLVAAIPLLVITGYFDGSITRWRDVPTLGVAKYPKSKAPRDQTVFAGVIQPILERRCVTCHGPTHHKADLRLDNLAVLLNGGQNGSVLNAGHAEQSSLLQRILLPLDHDGHMPPEDEPQVTPQEIVLLEWWINAGAPADARIVDLKPAPKIRDLLELVSRRAE